MKIVIKIFRTLIILTSLSLLSACGGGGIAGTGIVPVEVDANQTPVALTTIASATIPFREHGYSNFETVVLNTQEEYDAFITEVNAQASWNDKALFLQQLQSLSVNFTNQNLLIYRITEH